MGSISGSVILNKVLNLSKPYLNHLTELSNTLFFIRLQRCIGIRHSGWHWFLDIHGWSVGFTMKNVCHWNKVSSAAFLLTSAWKCRRLAMALSKMVYLSSDFTDFWQIYCHFGGNMVPRSWKEAFGQTPLLSILALSLPLV